MKPHKHAELIKAWADGVEVEYRLYDSLKGWGDWKYLAHDQPFLSDPWWDYRIKPEPKPDVVMTTCVYPWRGQICMSTADPNLRLTFNNEGTKLLAAEVL